MRLTDFFERVCVLNLSYKPERRARLSAQLEALDLADPQRITWVRAICGERCPAPGYFRAGNGAWGCLLTHLRAVQDAALDDAASCLLLEDDVIFHPQSQTLLDRFLPALPANWDQVYLGGQHLQEADEVGAGSVVWRAKNVNRTHAYALSRRGYQRFMQHILHAPDYIAHGIWHLDHQLGVAHERLLWNAYCPSWWIAGQGDGASTISGRTHAELWWQPSRYARHLPFIFVPTGLEKAKRAILERYVHFGWNLQPDTLTDRGLDQIVSGFKGLGEWMLMIAREALDCYRLPGLCHPGITLESARKQWASVIPFESSLDLAELRDYPANGLFENPLFAR